MASPQDETEARVLKFTVQTFALLVKRPGLVWTEEIANACEVAQWNTHANAAIPSLNFIMRRADEAETLN